MGVPAPNVQSTEALDEFGLPSGPSAAHPFGVDQLGRDVFARTIYGARVSLEVAVIGTGLSVIIGVIFGMLSGFYRGWVDTAIARVIDVLLAFPVLLLGMGLAVACSDKNGCLEALKPGPGGLLQPGLSVVLFIIVLANWPYVARIMRGQVLSLREKEFVEAARSLGASNTRIIFRDILPNLVAPIIVYATLFIPANILLEAALSFLGVGIQPPQSSLGPDAGRLRHDLRLGLVVLPVPRPRPAAHRAGLQPARRRHAGRPEPEGHEVEVILPAHPTHPDPEPTMTKGSSMRRSTRTLFLGALLALSLGLAACGGDDEGGGEEGASTGAPVEGKQGGKLTMLWTDDVDFIDPGQTYYTLGSMVVEATQKPLYGYKPDDSHDARCPTSRRATRRSPRTARPSR